MSGHNPRFVEHFWSSGDAGTSEIVDATPPLAGGGAVGLRQYHATDASRLDPSTGVRQFMAAVWYPAKADAEAVRSGPLDLLLESVDPALGLLAEKSEQSVDVQAARAWLKTLTFRAQHGLEAAGGQHPVLVFYPPGQGHRFSKAGVCESLASLGYIVVAIDAPRDAPLIALPDGRLVTGPLGKNEDYIWPRVADIGFLLDQLPSVNASGSLAGRLDLENIGMFGSSRGGYLSNIMAVVDQRVKAAVNIDGFLWGIWAGKSGTGLNRYPPEWQALARESRTPVLRIQGDQGSTEVSRANFARERQDFGGEFIYACLREYSHGSFAPTPWLSGDLEKCLNLETQPDFESYGLLMTLLSGFFGQHLNKGDNEWLDRLTERSDLDLMMSGAS